MLMDAELEVCESNKERIAVLEQILAIAKDNETIASIRPGASVRGRQAGALLATAERLRVEIALEKAKANLGTAARIKELQKERLATTRELAKLQTLRFNNDRDVAEEVVESTRMLMNAELEVCESNKERLAILERILAAAKENEMVTSRPASSVRSGRTDIFLTLVERLRIEIALEQAKDNPEKEASIKKLQKSRLQASRELAKQKTLRFKGDVALVEDVLEATRMLMDAELRSCESNEERIAALQRILATAKENESTSMTIVKCGLARLGTSLKAKAERLRIEIALERAKADNAATRNEPAPEGCQFFPSGDVCIGDLDYGLSPNNLFDLVLQSKKEDAKGASTPAQGNKKNSRSIFGAATIRSFFDDGQDPDEALTWVGNTSQKGDAEKATTLPATIHAFESVRMFSRVPGFLKKQTVDIGDRIKRDQVLAILDTPDIEAQLEHDTAVVNKVRSQVREAKARVDVATANLKTAEAALQQAEASAKSAAAWVRYRAIQLERMKQLVDAKGIDERLYNESKERHDAAVETEVSAKAAIETARAHIVAGKVRIEQATSEVAQANLKKTQVQLSYATIKAPFDGMVAERGFIRSADTATVPLFTVQRTDLMRRVVYVPDRDVPFIHKGTTAEIEIESLPGKKWSGKVARIALTLYPKTRSMRIEIDLPNPTGQIYAGMEGNATIVLDRTNE
jgi:multidrug efflux pump subunit AcrA (membrane-fusion protein)